MYGSHSGASDREIVAQTFAVEELLTVLKLIPQLKSLELRSLPVYRDMWTLPLVGWPADFHPTTPNPQSLRDARLSLESLRLFNMASFVADPSCLQAFLTIFERIDDLQFTDCQVPNYNRPIGRDITYWVPFEMMRHAPLQTKRLTISTFRSSSFLAMFNLFSGIVDGAGIEYLELDPTDGGLRSYTNDAASAYMARLTGLKELILRIPCHRIENWNSQFITLPSLAPLHNLRKVSVYDLPVHSVEERRGLTNLPALRVIADSIFNEVYALLESARRATLTHVHLGFETMGTVLHARTATSHLRTTFVKNHWHRFLGARCFAADAFQELSLDGIWSTEWSKATLRGSAEIRAVAGKLIPQ
ncbi:hypothetical protein PsYK624_011910 [Phanerochaete sordida]|uniref:Uncharacterized protein n=1 Tax=Phanerochaete sordida TaxID=48140 RepID=A0A9P3FZR6_9APHY|nr:hypothetical protein PsYK624_011910 [Phanerochaete sordida]